MRSKLSIYLLTGVLIFVSVSVSAQEERVAKKYDNPEWKNVFLIDYKSGKMERAREIIREYYAPATEKAGTSGPQMVMVLHSGEYDLMVIWAMEGGIEDMNWDINPNNIKWRNALIEIAGGKEEARKIMDEYSSCINRSTNYIARVD